MLPYLRHHPDLIKKRCQYIQCRLISLYPQHLVIHVLMNYSLSFLSRSRIFSLCISRNKYIGCIYLTWNPHITVPKITILLLMSFNVFLFRYFEYLSYVSHRITCIVLRQYIDLISINIKASHLPQIFAGLETFNRKLRKSFLIRSIIHSTEMKKRN